MIKDTILSKLNYKYSQALESDGYIVTTEAIL